MRESGRHRQALVRLPRYSPYGASPVLQTRFSRRGAFSMLDIILNAGMAIVKPTTTNDYNEICLY